MEEEVRETLKQMHTQNLIQVKLIAYMENDLEARKREIEELRAQARDDHAN